jgi:hypothetical protein
VLREAEVRDERTVPGVEEDVLGLEVPVHDPERVGPSERARERAPERDRLLDPERALLDPGAERPARQERHDEVGALGRAHGVEERHEAVHLAQLCLEPPLAFEAREGLRVVLREELDRDGLRGPGDAGAVDDAHAAAADLALELVDAEPHARH